MHIRYSIWFKVDNSAYQKLVGPDGHVGFYDRNTAIAFADGLQWGSELFGSEAVTAVIMDGNIPKLDDNGDCVNDERRTPLTR